jgi:tRNA(adenine34) deaminase
MNDQTWMTLAMEQAEKALKSGEFPVGCVVVADGRVLAAGHRAGTAGSGRNETDHAEMTALRRLQASLPEGGLRHASLYCTMEPCLMCFGAILLSGIGRIVYAYEDVMGGGTGCDVGNLPPLYRKRCPEISAHVMRKESLTLFKVFFRNPDNRYWKESLLARYTLAQ